MDIREACSDTSQGESFVQESMWRRLPDALPKQFVDQLRAALREGPHSHDDKGMSRIARSTGEFCCFVSQKYGLALDQQSLLDEFSSLKKNQFSIVLQDDKPATILSAIFYKPQVDVPEFVLELTANSPDRERLSREYCYRLRTFYKEVKQRDWMNIEVPEIISPYDRKRCQWILIPELRLVAPGTSSELALRPAMMANRLAQFLIAKYQIPTIPESAQTVELERLRTQATPKNLPSAPSTLIEALFHSPSKDVSEFVSTLAKESSDPKTRAETATYYLRNYYRLLEQLFPLLEIDPDQISNPLAQVKRRTGNARLSAKSISTLPGVEMGAERGDVSVPQPESRPRVLRPRVEVPHANGVWFDRESFPVSATPLRTPNLMAAQAQLIESLVKRPELTLNILSSVKLSDLKPAGSGQAELRFERKKTILLDAATNNALITHVESLLSSTFAKAWRESENPYLFLAPDGGQLIVGKIKAQEWLSTPELFSEQLRLMSRLLRIELPSDAPAITLKLLSCLDLKHLDLAKGTLSIPNEDLEIAAELALTSELRRDLSSYREIVRTTDLAPLWENHNPNRYLFMSPAGEALDLGF